MRKKSKLQMMVFLLGIALSISGAPINFADDLANWKQLRIGCEKSGDCVRAAVLPHAKGNFGQLWKYVKPIPEGKYLQIKVDGMENSGSNAWVGSVSDFDRRSFGVIFHGINTFSPRIGKTFAFSINQWGARNKAGAWIDYRSYEISEAPENSLTAVKEPAAGALKAGDTLHFRIFRPARCANPVKVRVFIMARGSRNLQDFRLCKEQSFEMVYNEKEKCYSAGVKVTDDAYSLDTTAAKIRLIAAADLDGVESYFTMPFPVKLETANKIPEELFAAATPTVRDNRRMWFDLTLNRKNLALGKRIKFIPRPAYPLTEDRKGEAGNDELDLTDGSLSSHNDDKIWFDRKAVGFFDGSGNKDFSKVLMRIDLGKVAPVDYIALRALGGAVTHFRWPKKFEVLVSKDGKTFFAASEMNKLAPAEAAQSDFVTTYYYPEDRPFSESVCKTFRLPVNADARYIIVKLTLDVHFFSDEMAVIAAEKKDAGFNRAYQGKGIGIPNDGLTAGPRVPELAVVKGVPAPQEIEITDYRPEPRKIEKAEVILELPEPLTVHNFKAEKITVGGVKYSRFRLPVNAKLKLKYIYILSGNDTPDRLPPADIYVEYDGKTGFKQSLPLKIVTLPEFKTFRKIPICLAWMNSEALLDAYPGFLKNYQRFGFNSAGVFPRYYIGRSEAVRARVNRKYEQLRQAGLIIFMNDSSVHEFLWKHKKGSEVFCITDPASKLVCPSYTGKFYRQEMERIARCAVMSKPDHVLLDIECFGSAFRRSAKECSRCVEAIRKSGLSETEYMYSCGKRLLSDISAALAKAAKEAGIPMPVLHLYGLDCESQYGICRFSDVYPAIVKTAQPSLYVGAHPEEIHRSVRSNYRQIGRRDIMPWLTTGCYGEYDSRWVEPIVLEALMNGAGGILYFQFSYFADSPLDFYYHALAVMKLAPYEDLLINGEYSEVRDRTGKMLCSVVRRGNEMLLLAGNYLKAEPSTAVTLPFGKAKGLDLNTGKSFSADREFEFRVEPGRFALFHITEKL